MCWDNRVSLLFSAIFLIINLTYVVIKPHYWKEYFLFGTFYFIMEMFQTLQWLYGDVGTCTQMNAYFTFMAYLLIWLQPLLFSYIGLRTSRHRRFFVFMTIVNMCVLTTAVYSMYSARCVEVGYDIPNSIFSQRTCTTIGKTGHLVWKYKVGTVDYAPNYLLYLLLCILSFLMYDRIGTQVVGIGWFICLIITKLVLSPQLLEMASSWCLMSIIANAVIYGYVMLIEN
jgi:hypothetical protein